MREIYRSAIGFNKFTTKKWFNTAAALGAAMALFAAPLGAQGDQAAKDKKKKEKTPPVEFTEEAQSSPKANPEANEGANEEEAYRAVSKGAVITASRIDTERSKTPAVVQVIDRQDIERSVSTTADELLIEAGLGHVYKLPGATSDKIAIRGVTSASMGNPWKGNVKILINGQPTLMSTPAILQNSIIEKIEIVKGPTSVVYGSGASGGVINIITKKPIEQSFSGQVGIGGGSFGAQKAELDFSGMSGNFFYGMAGTYFSSDDYDTPEDGTIKNTENNSISSRLIAGYSFSENHDISLTVENANFWDIGSPGPRSFSSETDYIDMIHYDATLNYKNDNLRSSIFFGDYEKTNYIPEGQDKDEHTESWSIYGGSLQNMFTILNQELLVGSEWEHTKLHSTSKNKTPYSPDATSNEIGIFSEIKLHYNDILFANAGVRYDEYHSDISATEKYTITENNKYSYSQPSYRGGILYKPVPKIGIKANAGTGFRAPAPEERGVYNKSVSYSGWPYEYTYAGNPSLKVERTRGADVGFEFHDSNLFLSLSWFTTEYTDKIEWEYAYGFDVVKGVSTVLATPNNIKGASIQGAEALLNWSLFELPQLGLNIALDTSLTWHYKRLNLDADSVQTNNTDTIFFTPDLVANSGLTIGGKSFDLTFMGRYKGTESFNSWVTFQTEETEPFWVFSAKGVYRFKETIQAEASVDNLLDTQYSYVEGYPMPGRNFTFGVKYKFL